MAEFSPAERLTLLLALLRKALWDTPLPEKDLISLRQMDDSQWEALIRCAEEQTVSGLVYLALSELPEGARLSDPGLTRLLTTVNRTILSNRRIWRVEDRLMTALSVASLHPVPMKGRTCAMRYPRPELREAGDIDLYLPPGEFQSGISLAESQDLSVGRAPDGSAHYTLEGIDIDIHPDYYDLSADSLPPVPSPEAEILMLGAHVLKHAMGPGVGLRQLCDFALALRAFPGGTKRAEELFRGAGIGRWGRLLISFVSAYLDPACPSCGTRPQPLLRIVLRGGNFGHHARGRLRNLSGSGLRSKADTAWRMLLRLPFALRFAPQEGFRRIKMLVKGNIKSKPTETLLSA